MLFIMSINLTEQGIRGIKDAPKRMQAARDLAKKCGCEVKDVYLTSGDSDLMVIIETLSGDNVAKFALANGMLGNVRSRTVRGWPEDECFQPRRARSASCGYRRLVPRIDCPRDAPQDEAD